MKTQMDIDVKDDDVETTCLTWYDMDTCFLAQKCHDEKGQVFIFHRECIPDVIKALKTFLGEV